MVARWINVLDTNDFEVQQRKAFLHVNANVISSKPRRKCSQENCECTASTVHVIRPTSKSVSDLTSNCLLPISKLHMSYRP